MKKYLLMPKQKPRPSDSAELLMNGVKILQVMFAGACMVVESPEDLVFSLNPEMWVVEPYEEEPAQRAPVST